MKKDKLEAVTRKKKKERKEELQGESAMDKPQIPNKTTASITHLTSRSTETQDKKVLCSSQCSPMGLSKALTGLLEQSHGRVSPEEGSTRLELPSMKSRGLRTCAGRHL